jgi:hypothetical protein
MSFRWRASRLAIVCIHPVPAGVLSLSWCIEGASLAGHLADQSGLLPLVLIDSTVVALRNSPDSHAAPLGQLNKIRLTAVFEVLLQHI